MEYFQVAGNCVCVDGEYYCSPGETINSVTVYRDLAFVFFKSESVSQQNVFTIDLKKNEKLWTIPPLKRTERDGNNPYVGILTGLSTEDYIVLCKWDSWRVAVDPKNGNILYDIDLNTGRRPW